LNFGKIELSILLYSKNGVRVLKLRLGFKLRLIMWLVTITKSIKWISNIRKNREQSGNSGELDKEINNESN